MQSCIELQDNRLKIKLPPRQIKVTSNYFLGVDGRSSKGILPGEHTSLDVVVTRGLRVLLLDFLDDCMYRESRIGAHKIRLAGIAPNPRHEGAGRLKGRGSPGHQAGGRVGACRGSGRTARSRHVPSRDARAGDGGGQRAWWGVGRAARWWGVARVVRWWGVGRRWGQRSIGRIGVSGIGHVQCWVAGGCLQVAVQFIRSRWVTTA